MAETAGEARARADQRPAADSAMDKTLRILEATASSPVARPLGELATEARVGKPSAHRLLGMLAAEHYVSAEGGGRYGIGPRLRALAAKVNATPSGEEVAELLRGLQAQVGDNTIHMSVRTGDRAVYVHKINGLKPYQMASRVGMQLTLHCTAAGKCILAGLPADEVTDILGRTGLPAKTPATITDRRRLLKELTAVRERGYAVDDEENETTIRCIAAPVLDRAGAVVGGISVSTVVFAVTRDELQTFAGPLATTAAALSRLQHW